MTDFLIDARNRLIPPERLLQVVALLNMPDQGEGGLDDGVPEARQQATLYRKIAEWALLSAQAAETLSHLDFSGIRNHYAYVVEYTDEHTAKWHEAPGDAALGTDLSADTPETVVRAVLDRYVKHLAENRDAYELWLVDSISLRVSVWNTHVVAGSHPRVLLPGDGGPPVHARVLQRAGVSPHAVEVRTPVQVHRLVQDQALQ
ncbi:hypothetical protein AB0F88_17120 [Streptosporangium sp. NPDC023963]|uniref:hypothetical protein n=1 Tax=Streptosporangium sp. NPDC023963 TaxID=3155608 RepID=UPI003434050B